MKYSYLTEKAIFLEKKMQTEKGPIPYVLDKENASILDKYIKMSFAARTPGGEKKRSRINMLLQSIKDESWQVVNYICESKWGALASVWSSFDDEDTEKSVLPIHLACQKRGLTEEALKRLIDAYPAGMKTADKRKGRLPLHLACRYGASYDIIAILTIQYNVALYKMDKKGFLPINYAKKYCDDEVVDFLLDAM